MSCERERELVLALRNGTLSQELREHTSGCEQCAEAMMVSMFLLQEAEAAESEAVIPSAESVWWKARLDARRKAVQQAARPITILTNVAYLVGLCAAIWFVLFSGQVEGWLRSARFASESTLTTHAAMISGLGIASVLVFLLGSLYLMYGEE